MMLNKTNRVIQKYLLYCRRVHILFLVYTVDTTLWSHGNHMTSLRSSQISKSSLGTRPSYAVWFVNILVVNHRLDLRQICGVEWENVYFDESMRFEILADITKKRALIRTPFFHLFVLCKLLPFFWSWSSSFLMHRTRVIASQRQRNKKYNKSSFLLACIGFEREGKKTENCKLIFGTKMA